MPVKDEDLLRLLDAAAEPDPGRILDALLQVTGAERGCLVMRDGIPVLRDMKADELRVSRTLLARALSDGRPLVASAADLATIESVASRKVRSVLVLPLKTSGCAVYLDNGTFDDVDRLSRFASSLDKALAHRHHGYGELIGQSKAMAAVYTAIERMAPAPYPILIVGESGTGKELVARALHRKGPYVAANCAALPEQLVLSELFGHGKGSFTGADRDHAGLFEQAHGGILFLDEVACLSAAAQEALLRVLETGEIRRVGASRSEKVDVRVVAATNEDLEQSDEFRKDLYYRLNVLRIELPTLRERREDIPLIARRRLEIIAKQLGRRQIQLSNDALGTLLEHPWPGNVRELVNALERAAVLNGGELLSASDFVLARPRQAPSDGIVSLDDHIRDTLHRFDGRLELQEIADKLGISRKTLWEKKKKWGL
ncbi:MAG TPA: sigma-54 dependent transcriptional regulator [Planctomycetota bacterium]|nr:sigma-54 dependent transcriptional regulator [Planctomycetota bacterium]